MLKIEYIEKQEQWDTFLTTLPHGNILQSWIWGDFQKELGRKIWRLGIFNEDRLVGVALAYKIPTRLRTHIYLSNGPEILPEFFVEGFTKLTGFLKALGIQEKAKFVRIDPIIEESEKNNEFFKSLRLKKSPTHVQPQCKWILDISKDENELLKDMKSNDTRIKINKATKEGVLVSNSTDVVDYEQFEQLLVKTVNRQNFIPHPLSYYQTQFRILSPNNYRVFLAKKDGEVLAGALIGYFGDTAFYLHGGSNTSKDLNKYRGTQACIWEAIKYAKEKGFKYFDFWGVAEKDNKKDPWSGFTTFKKGFGGYMFKTIFPHDLPLSPSYLVISTLERYNKVWSKAYYQFTKIIKK
ncbi:peptidoglycan bridge formation glycyltransferase FemA/FemB family protein [Candidatus Dojkabacteria bacterium]|jgi:lipid II:glycine glycyltransferase (peptidoglycan interpeptide bridge formation enzyme)|nr:peptidoglycan bridge formation glycyltransferase FemA/FemB family protein [Candidatus Dojkabacteria bacterium]